MTRETIRNLCFVLLGAAALVLKGNYSGSLEEVVHSYGGNLSASSALYFVIRISIFGSRFGKLATAGVTLLVVELFEINGGFGLSVPLSQVLTDVYDPIDFLANAIGVGFALVIDTVAAKIS